MLPLSMIDTLKERRDKRVSKLFMKKLELLLEKEENHIFRCTKCDKLLTIAQQEKMFCMKSQAYIDPYGKL